MPALTYQTARPHCPCIQEDTMYGLRGKSDGFTMVEIVIVVVIIAIAALAAVPMMSSAASLQIRSAANMIAADLEYAKSMAISRGQNYSVVFDKDADSYKIVDPLGNVIQHPIKKGFTYVDVERRHFQADRSPELRWPWCLCKPGSGARLGADQPAGASP